MKVNLIRFCMSPFIIAYQVSLIDFDWLIITARYGRMYTSKIFDVNLNSS